MNIRSYLKKIADERWNIGFIRNSIESVLRGEQITVDWLKHDIKDSWFADPFILDVRDDTIYVLVEEFYKPIQRGRISKLIIDRNTFELISKEVALELATHLSFPAIIRKGNDIYIYPENGESGELVLYQYYQESNKCVKHTILLNESVADAIIAIIDNKEYLFCTKQPNPNGNILSVLQKNEQGKYILIDSYSFQENVARMAGNFFEFEGKLYRPTQESNIQYGHAVTLQEVKQENGKFHFLETQRLFSVHPTLNIGMHTFNMYKGIIVTDALGFKNMWIRKILKKMGLLH